VIDDPTVEVLTAVAIAVLAWVAAFTWSSFLLFAFAAWWTFALVYICYRAAR